MGALPTKPCPAHSLGHRIRLVPTGAVRLGRFCGRTEIPQSAVVHGRYLEAEGEDHEWGDDAKGAGPMRVEVPAELAVKCVPIPILELCVDLRIWQILVLTPKGSPELDAHRVRRQGHRHG